MTTKATILAILAENSYPAFQLEYEVYKSNHLAHGLIALYQLGASEETIRQFRDVNSEKLDKVTVVADPSCVNVDQYLASRSHFAEIHAYYKKLLASSSVDEVLKAKLPLLAEGLNGALYHPLIHIGYGYSVGSAETILDGLAYQHYSYLPINSADVWTGLGQEQLETVLLDLVKDEKLKAAANLTLPEEARKSLWDLSPNQHWLYCMALFEGETLMSYAQRLGLGRTATRVEMIKFVIDASLELYIKCVTRNDFYLLHGITSGWSLLKIEHLFLTDEHVRRAIGLLLAGLMAVFLFRRDGTELVHSVNRELDPKSWDEIRSQAVQMATKNNVHITKVVQVCDQMRMQFPEQEVLYQHGALLALDCTLSEKD